MHTHGDSRKSDDTGNAQDDVGRSSVVFHDGVEGDLLEKMRVQVEDTIKL